MNQTAASNRLVSIDFLRGLVMVIMALDHVRDFLSDARFDPLDLDQTSPALFLTRWITHFCAPIFVLLAGTSAGLMAARRATASLSLFLLTRGLWLIFIEITIISFGWQFNLSGFFFVLQVIWVIGLSMIVMAGLVWLPKWVMPLFGLALVFGHNLLDYGLFPPMDWSAPSPFWHILHSQGYGVFFGVGVGYGYQVLPWVGVMPLGFWLAGLYEQDAGVRRNMLLRLGTGSIALFIVLRAFNIYGDPTDWSVQDSMVKSVLSFINVTKYPPSLQYLLLMVGPGLLVLAWAEGTRGRVAGWLVTLGRVPFFYYVLHIYLAHALALVGAEWLGLGWRAAAQMFFSLPEGYGFGLGVVWAAWAAVVIALYPACKWFAGVKARRKDWWLSYL